MKILRFESHLSKADFLEVIKNNAFVNEGVVFDDKRGKPSINVKEKDGKLKITCRMVDGPTKDNGFLIGTYFKGKITERDGKTTLRGVVVTDPVYHAFMLGLIGFFIYRCITLGGFNVVPICVSLFGFLFMKDEYKKQGIIARYLARAVRKAERTHK